MERSLRTYYNYIQDDRARWISIVEFSNNNNTSSATGIIPFYLNKGFHLRMSFDPDTINYESTRDRLIAAEAQDITERMKELLEFGCQ